MAGTAPMIRGRRSAPTTRIARALVVSGLLVPGSVASAEAQEAPTTLRLEGRAGERATFRYEQRIALQMPPEFGGDQRVASRLEVDRRVEEVEEASIRYLAEVRDVSVKMESSPTADDLDFSRFEGQRFRMTLDRRGELLTVEPVGESDVGVTQLQQSMRQVGFPVLPRRAVRVGETWVDTTRIDAAAMALPAEGEIVSISRTTLERLIRTPEGRVAQLDVETEFHFEPGAGAIPGMRVEVDGRRTDEVRFHVERGRFLTSTGNQEFEMTMAIPGATGSLSIRGTATSRAERLPGS